MTNYAWHRKQLNLLSYLAPPIAGRIATRLFSLSRNETNKYREPLTPIGAKAIPLSQVNGSIKNIYLWGDSNGSQDKRGIVLLIHGWGTNCSSMFGFVQPLLENGRRVATFDAPAHGSTRGNYTTMTEWVEATKAIIDRLSLEGPVNAVVAHSLGGIVCMAACSKRDDVRQLVLLAAPFSLTGVLDNWSRNFMKLRPTIHKQILKNLLQDNGVPVSHWDIGIHGKEWSQRMDIVHDVKDPIVDSSNAHRISNALSDAKTNVHITQGLNHFKVLTNKKVQELVANAIG